MAPTITRSNPDTSTVVCVIRTRETIRKNAQITDHIVLAIGLRGFAGGGGKRSGALCSSSTSFA